MPQSSLPRALAAALTCTALVSTLVACGSDSAEDGGEDSLVLYSGRNEDLVQPVIDDFTQETGIEVEVRYGDSAEMAAQLLEEGDRSPAQVFLAQDAGALGAVADEGLLRTLPERTLDSVPEDYRDDDGRWVGVTGRSRVLVYNKDQVTPAELPDSVFDLTAPTWKGRVGVAPTNASFQSFVTAMRVQHGDDRARQWLADLEANGAEVRENNVEIVGNVNDGNLDAGLVNHYYLYELANELDTDPGDLAAALHFFPDGDTGALVNVSGVALVGKQVDGDAQAFVDHLLSEQGQTYFTEETSEYPLSAGVEPASFLPPLAELETPDIDLNSLEDLQATVAMISEAGLT